MKDKNLLVMIDDDQDDHEIFNMALADVGKEIRCISFSDCEHAIAHFEQQRVETPAFVFMDLTLPRINGAECLLQLKKLSEFDHPCIVIYSAALPEAWYKSLSEIGVNKFLQKSGSIAALTDQLRGLLND